MVRELSLIKETDQFTFIRTIKATPNPIDRNKFSKSTLLPESSERFSHTKQNSYQDSSDRNPPNQQVSDQSLAQNHLGDRHKPNSSALQTVNQEKLSSHLSLTNHPISISDRWYQPDFSKAQHSLFVPTIFIPPLETDEPKPEHKPHKYLDKLLIVAALSYCGFLGWLLFGGQGSVFPIGILQKSRPQISQADLDFLAYLEESLSVIDSTSHPQKQSINSQSTSQKDDLVYLPIYTPTPPAPSTNNFPLNPNSLLPPPPPANNLAALNPPLATNSIKQPTPPALSKPSTSSQASDSHNLGVASSQLPNLSNQQQAKTHKVSPQNPIQPTLVGIIELKTNSAALFNLNGNTEKIWLGDQVGNTGWKLLAISNQKAKVSYQGQELTLGIGQSFNANPN